MLPLKLMVLCVISQLYDEDKFLWKSLSHEVVKNDWENQSNTVYYSSDFVLRDGFAYKAEVNRESKLQKTTSKDNKS